MSEDIVVVSEAEIEALLAINYHDKLAEFRSLINEVDTINQKVANLKGAAAADNAKKELKKKHQQQLQALKKKHREKVQRVQHDVATQQLLPRRPGRPRSQKRLRKETGGEMRRKRR